MREFSLVKSDCLNLKCHLLFYDGHFCLGWSCLGISSKSSELELYRVVQYLFQS